MLFSFSLSLTLSFLPLCCLYTTMTACSLWCVTIVQLPYRLLTVASIILYYMPQHTIVNVHIQLTTFKRSAVIKPVCLPSLMVVHSQIENLLHAKQKQKQKTTNTLFSSFYFLLFWLNIFVIIFPTFIRCIGFNDLFKCYFFRYFFFFFFFFWKQ